MGCFAAWLNDEGVASGLLRVWPINLDGALAWYESRKGSLKALPFTICELSESKPVGFAEITEIHWVHQVGELWILIGSSDLWGKGLASEALRLLLDYAFDSLGLRKLHVKVRTDNEAAVRLYQKLGFEREGIFAKEYLAEGRYVDLFRMAIFNPRRKD
jgi:RimJ/RimL family protein N-acetyltransferase